MALLPGTSYMEMATAAFLPRLPDGAVEFRDVFFLVPLMFEGDETREVHVQLRRDQGCRATTGAFRFSIFSRTHEWSNIYRHDCALLVGAIGNCRS